MTIRSSSDATFGSTIHGDTEQVRQIGRVLTERKKHVESIENYLWN